MQVDSARPKEVLDQDFASYSSSVGTIYPETRRVWVTRSISTIAQFRTLDYGMEICELHLKFPPPFPGKEPVRVSLYRLDSNRMVNPNTLSHKTAPSRVVKLAEIDQSIGEYTRNLTCVSDQLLTFELGCSDGSNSHCVLDWLQTPRQKSGASKSQLPLNFTRYL
ncbi:hypothetical protein DL96DRAFT_1473506 [Flagelloscypha sp. PMI_526]|nr:hypothetical protein DL96DRAFT_1473506 [Flagelloscypha sp. PMI_526]